VTILQTFWIVAQKVALVCGVPVYLGAAAFEYWTRTRPKKKTKRIERSVDVLGAHRFNHRVAQLEAEGFTFSRIRRGNAYFIKDIPSSDTDQAGEAE
jgi:hypothetical protein